MSASRYRRCCTELGGCPGRPACPECTRDDDQNDMGGDFSRDALGLTYWFYVAVVSLLVLLLASVHWGLS